MQIFYGDKTPTTSRSNRIWNKPPGVSHVYMMLIGCGAAGDSITGGGSGAVTVWYGAAQNVPDSLRIAVGNEAARDTNVYTSWDTSNSVLLLQAKGASSSTGATAMTANTSAFLASGFYQSVGGQDGSAGTQSASSTTFLSGGSASGTTSNYGYTNGASNRQGFFMLQPIIVGVGGAGNGRGDIGCGGGSDPSNPVGGQGMVLIASW